VDISIFLARFEAPELEIEGRSSAVGRQYSLTKSARAEISPLGCGTAAVNDDTIHTGQNPATDLKCLGVSLRRDGCKQLDNQSGHTNRPDVCAISRHCRAVRKSSGLLMPSS